MPFSRYTCVTALLAFTAAANAGLRVLAASSAGGTAAGGASGATSASGEKEFVFAWWEVLSTGSRASMLQLLSPRWWVDYIAAEYAAEPAHVVVETLCLLTIAYLVLWRKPQPMAVEKLSKKEEEELIAEWKPEPLCPVLEPSTKTRFVVEGVTGRTVVANGGQRFVNFASANFLGLADKPEIMAACRATIEKYGVGSCGPRGFYGTFDLHLQIEAALARFLQADECILYSDSIACVSSVIPAFAKKGDTLVLDAATNFGIQQGALLSRSTVHYYKHNDMADLEAVLQSIAAKENAKGRAAAAAAARNHRKFIVCEGVSSVYGDVAPLAAIVALKHKYSYRLIVDDSLGFGVLGAAGRGSAEHAGVSVQSGAAGGAPGVDILCGGMDGALASVGGFCVGSHQVVDHQRLSGAGYCFSASSPPYTSTASLLALECLENDALPCAALRKRATRVRRALASAHRGLTLLGGESSAESPVLHLALKGSAALLPFPEQRVTLQALLDHLRTQCAIVASVPEFIPADRSANTATPTLRVMLTAAHTEADCDKLIKGITNAAQQLL